MNILVLTSSYPKHDGESTSPYVQDLYEHIAGKGHAVHVVLPHFPGGPRSELRNGVHLHYFRYAPDRWETLCYGSGIPEKIKKYWKYRFMFGFFFLAQTWTGLRLLRRERIDAISCHWLLSALSGLVLGALFRKPLVLTIYGVEVFVARTSRLLKRMCDFVFRRTTSIVTISRYNLERFQDFDLGSSSLELIYVGPQTRLFTDRANLDRMKEPKTMSRQKPVSLLFVGRLVERKGVIHLVHALPAMIEAIPGLTLHIVGNGPERERLESEVTALGLADRVVFHGFIDDSTLAGLYDAAHLFVFPSIVDSKGDTEGLGIVTFESWVYGLPVVASGVGGILDTVIHEQTGLQTPPGDSAAIAKAVIRIVDEPDLARGLVANGQRMLHEVFNWNLVADQYVEVFSKASARNKVHG